VRWNLKEAESKILHRRTETAYKACGTDEFAKQNKAQHYPNTEFDF